MKRECKQFHPHTHQQKHNKFLTPKPKEKKKKKTIFKDKKQCQPPKNNLKMMPTQKT
jgi:hypothetical protein